MAALTDPYAPKENANPTVLSVPSRRLGTRPPALGSEFVARYNLRRPVDFLLSDATIDAGEGKWDEEGHRSEYDEYGIDYDVGGRTVCDSLPSVYSTTPGFGTGCATIATERSAHIALSAAAVASSPSRGRDFVGLLRAAGFVLPPSSDASVGTTVASGRGGGGGGGGVSVSIKRAAAGGGSSSGGGKGPLSRPAFVPASRTAQAVGGDGGGAALPDVGRDSARNSRVRDDIDADEVYEIIRNIQDPEHPLTLEQLGVVSRTHVTVVDAAVAATDAGANSSPPGRQTFSTVDVMFKPTIPHCSMATLIGLCLRVKLLRSLPRRFKVKVRIQPGTHQSEMAINRQLDDKERVCAALENDHLRGVVDRCIADGMRRTMNSR